MDRSTSRREFVLASLAGGVALGLGAHGSARAGTTRSTGGAGPKPPRALIEGMPPLLERHGVLGLALGVTHGDESFPLAFGRASIPFDVPATPHTLFHLGSVGKHFTATAVLQLVEQGKLGLDDPVGRHLQDIPDAWAGLRIASLLHHVSGVPEYEGEDFDETRPHTRTQLIAGAAARPMLFDEGTAWSYSNTNYILLGYLIEAASGQTFADYLTARVLRAAGLVESRVDDAESLVPLRAEPYTRQPDGTFHHAIRMSSDYSGYADGPVLMSAADAPRWEMALRSGRLLSRASQETMLRPVRLVSGPTIPYGCAWFLDTTRGDAFHSHAGGVPGFTSFYLRLPAQGVSVMAATNVRLDSARVQQYIAWFAAEAVAPGTTILSLPPLQDDRPDLTAAARRLLLRGEQPLDRGLLAPELLTVVDHGGRAVMNRRSAVAPQTFAPIEQYRLGDGLLRRYRMVFDDVVEHVRIAYTPAGLAYWIFPG